MVRMFLLSFALILSVGTLSAATAPPVKMSKSGICHTTSSAWYSRTKSFTPFSTVEACLADGGRLPKGQGAAAFAVKLQSQEVSQTYDREHHFGSWIDEDGDCFNTRHEILASLSTGPVTTEDCRVIHGRWNDPYTGVIFHESRYLDIDHLVPLKWAWDHGADAWDREARISFANDPRNLFAVDAGANRAKGADGPLEWLPPNTSYRCEYVLRFKRIALQWKLDMSAHEEASMSRLQKNLCRE